MAKERRLRRLGRDTRSDFLRLHCDANGLGWCRCAAWWVESWEGWGDRTAEENLALREELLDRDEWDGYLAFESPAAGEPEEVVGWCQALPRDRLGKLVREHGLEPDPDTWAIPCLAVAPAARRRGLARWMVGEVLRDLARRGARRVEAFPRRFPADGACREEGELWNGPEDLWVREGFVLVREGDRRSVYARSFGPPATGAPSPGS